MADFLELAALLSSNLVASSADLLGSLDIAEDSALDEGTFDEETGEVIDQRIMEEDRQQILIDAFDEIAYRELHIGAAYPYTVNYEAFTITYTGDVLSQTGHLVYIFCLLASALREKRFEATAAKTVFLDSTSREIGNRFQICACYAAGAYLSGPVASFGFPRAEGSGFLPALRSAYQRFGAGAVRAEDDDILKDLPQSLKDGGVDVIAWRNFPDLMPGKLYLIGQCASGRNWRAKSVVEYIDQLHGTWFTQSPAKHCIPAMFIPFPFHHNQTQVKGRSFTMKTRTNFWNDEKRFGMIFDRLRISFLAHQYSLLPPSLQGEIDGSSRTEELGTWIGSLLNELRGASLAA
jgi:hypothetical protein